MRIHTVAAIVQRGYVMVTLCVSKYMKPRGGGPQAQPQWGLIWSGQTHPDTVLVTTCMEVLPQPPVHGPLTLAHSVTYGNVSKSSDTTTAHVTIQCMSGD